MGDHQKISTGTIWEQMAGYSRAVRAGNTIEVSGTAAVDEHGILVGPGDPYAQAHYILSKIEQALNAAGASLNDVVRTRMYVTDISLWQEFARAHGEYFKHIRPATSMVEVRSLIEPEMLIEIEATAILS